MRSHQLSKWLSDANCSFREQHLTLTNITTHIPFAKTYELLIELPNVERNCVKNHSFFGTVDHRFVNGLDRYDTSYQLQPVEAPHHSIHQVDLQHDWSSQGHRRRMDRW